ncbi:MAG: transcription antitermination factor NusB [Clostridia bacterium]|nr:transcription antitermination factor NusB [Clostridia bacterium]
MSRILARDTIFKLTFELCFHKPEEGCYYEEMLQENKLDEENLTFVKEFYEGIVEHFDELKEIVSKNIKGYTLDRLFKVDLAILIMATYELVYYKKNSVNIVANEAVELAKKYSTEKSYSFINAVVANIAKN